MANAPLPAKSTNHRLDLYSFFILIEKKYILKREKMDNNEKNVEFILLFVRNIRKN